MSTIIGRRPVAFGIGFGAAMIVLAVVVQLALEALVLGLGTWLGWWEKIRLTPPVNLRALVYLLPFAVMVFVPLPFGFAVPEVSLVEGIILPAWAALLVIIVGVALGAALSEEFHLSVNPTHHGYLSI